LSPWAFALFSRLPDFIRDQLTSKRSAAGKLKISQVETEKLLAVLCTEEMARRKKAGTYSGSFAPVTHNFGYQGRSALPSDFDCSLGSTMGFAAGVLIENNCNSMAVAVNQITSAPEQWRVGGVPLSALCGAESIKPETVDLHGKSVSALQKEIGDGMGDFYKNPGPTQFFLSSLTRVDQMTETSKLRFTEENEKAEKIRDLCQMIANQSVYSGDKAVLDSTLAQLEGIEKFYKSE
jgi:pyrophosphate--fructose-6-phosphate 1-phosphotransferase